MATKIEWCEETWNPITGCSPISEGCQNCYAKRMANRLRGRFGYPEDEPFRVTLHPDKLEQPLRWKKPRKIFVCSMSDLFHEDVNDEWLDRIFTTIRQCLTYKWYGETWHPVIKHTFLVLTKRPERMKMFIAEWLKQKSDYANSFKDLPSIPMRSSPAAKLAAMEAKSFMPHVWLGVTAENQKTANKRIPILMEIPAMVKFVSVEPMLGPVSIMEACDVVLDNDDIPSVQGIGNFLDWIICGTESGPGARPMQIGWARNLKDQCVDNNIPFFLKQMSVNGKLVKMPKLDGRVWGEYPDA